MSKRKWIGNIKSDKWVVAYAAHEAGHVLLISHFDRTVEKVCIRRRKDGSMLGYVNYRSHQRFTKDDWKKQAMISVAGGVAARMYNIDWSNFDIKEHRKFGYSPDCLVSTSIATLPDASLKEKGEDEWWFIYEITIAYFNSRKWTDFFSSRERQMFIVNAAKIYEREVRRFLKRNWQSFLNLAHQLALPMLGKNKSNKSVLRTKRIKTIIGNLQ